MTMSMATHTREVFVLLRTCPSSTVLSVVGVILTRKEALRLASTVARRVGEALGPWVRCSPVMSYAHVFPKGYTGMWSGHYMLRVSQLIMPRRSRTRR